MKKFKLFTLSTLLFASFALAACSGGNDNPSSSGQPSGGSNTSQSSTSNKQDGSLNPDGTANVYLVIKDGKLDGQAGKDFAELFIENAFVYTAAPGTDLPGADKVTSDTGATFLGWMTYEGGGAPTQYTKVPEVNNVILYANFDLGTGGQGGGQGGGESGGGGGDTPITEGVLFTVPGDWDKDNIYLYAWSGDGATKNADWPGVKLTNPTLNGYNETQYAFKVENYTNFILSDGNGKQTVDLLASQLAGKSGCYCDGTKDSQGHYNLFFW